MKKTCLKIKELFFYLLLLSPFITQAQIVNIPDLNFKYSLIMDTTINTNRDKEIQIDEAEKFDGTLYIEKQGITDLTGIEYFTNISSLICRYNNIDSLDLSKNISLTSIQCQFNNLAYLNLSGITYLQKLLCNNNLLTEIVISNNTTLKELDCSFNKIKELDISKNKALFEINCSNNDLNSFIIGDHKRLNVIRCNTNKLTHLDLSMTVSLSKLYCSNNLLEEIDLRNKKMASFLDATENPNLHCIDVISPFEYETSSSVFIPTNTRFDTDCNVNSVEFNLETDSGFPCMGTLSVDGNKYPISNEETLYINHLDNGSYPISVNADGYNPYRDTIVISKDEIINITIANITILNQTACGNYKFNDSLIVNSGIYRDTLTSINKQDSIVELKIDIFEEFEVSVDSTIAFGETVTFGDQILSKSGTYSNIFPSIHYCDSIVHLTLTVNPNNKPTLDIDNDTVWLDEHSPIGTLVATAKAYDIEEHTLTFFIENGDNIFDINEFSGEVRVKNQKLLDYETKEQYSLTVMVTDEFDTTERNIVVNLNDVNESSVSSDFTEKLEIFYNPATNQITISPRVIFSSMEIYTSIGSLAYSSNHPFKNNQQGIILHKGIYWVRLRNGAEQISRKIIIP